jgi:hypothetical protein
VPVAPLGLNDPTLILNFGAQLRTGDFADCLDTEQKWRLAEITAVDATHVLVHYVHWSTKWDGEFAPTARIAERTSRPAQPESALRPLACCG